MLKDAGFEVMLNPKGRPLAEEELVEHVRDVVGLIVGIDRITATVLEKAPALRVISKYGVGVDNIDLAAATAKNVVVTITPGSNSVAVAELTIGLMIAAARRLAQADRSVREGKWSPIVGQEVYGKTLGILGLGKIGKEVAKRAVAFGMKVVAFDSIKDKEFAERHEIEYVELESLLTISDFVSVHLPLTPSTRRLIGEAELRKIKSGAILMNTARGGIVDEQALLRALKEGWIAGAALDVYEEEPPTNPELLRLSNVVLTPHMGSHTVEAIQRMSLQAVQNLLLALQGKVEPEVVAN